MGPIAGTRLTVPTYPSCHHAHAYRTPQEQITRKPKSTAATMSDVRRIGFTELSGSKDVTRGPYRVKYEEPNSGKAVCN
jgi:hypothetical protein